MRLKTRMMPKEGKGKKRIILSTPPHAQTAVSSPALSSRRIGQETGDTATSRRSKRCSLPAIGLQTTVVTARTSIENEEAIVPVTTTGGEGDSEDGVGVVMGEEGDTGHLKRYSLVLAGRNSHQVDRDGIKGRQHEHSGQFKGLATTRLSDLLV